MLNGLLMLAMPLGLGVVLRRRAGGRWGLYGAGALTFIGSQVLHLPFNGLILNPQLEALGFGERGLSSALVLSAVLLGLSSGVFEEGARFPGAALLAAHGPQLAGIAHVWSRARRS